MNLTDLNINIEELLVESRAGIVTALTESVKQSLQWQVQQELAAQLKPIVTKFVTEEIAPELQNHLIGAKSEILAACVNEVSGVSLAVAKALMERIVKNLGDTYSANKIIEAMLAR